MQPVPIDKRSNGYKHRRDAVLHKPDAAIKLIQNALAAGITVSYVLMDTWFTNEPFIGRVLKEGLPQLFQVIVFSIIKIELFVIFEHANDIRIEVGYLNNQSLSRERRFYVAVIRYRYHSTRND